MRRQTGLERCKYRIQRAIAQTGISESEAYNMSQQWHRFDTLTTDEWMKLDLYIRGLFND